MEIKRTITIGSEEETRNFGLALADELAAGIKTGHTKEGFTGAIEKCGELLAEHFPAHSENPNELPDGLVILTED